MVKEKRGCDELSLLFEQYRTDKSEEVRNEIVNRTLYIAEIMAKKMAEESSSTTCCRLHPWR